MKVVAITMQKGGVGKTTLTRSLSAAAAIDGFLPLVLDMDAQASATMWSRRREEGQLPAVVFSTVPDLKHQLDRARAAGCQVAFIDTPPAQSNVPLAAVDVADLVLIPCTPDIEAFEQFPLTARVVRGSGAAVAGVVTMAAPNSMTEVDETKGVFTLVGVQAAPPVIFRRKVHRDACAAGKTAYEISPVSKGANEITSLWIWVREQLGLQRDSAGQKRSA